MLQSSVSAARELGPVAALQRPHACCRALKALQQNQEIWLDLMKAAMLQAKDAALDTPEGLQSPEGLVVQKCVEALVKVAGQLAVLHTAAEETAKAEKVLREVLQVIACTMTRSQRRPLLIQACQSNLCPNRCAVPCFAVP